MENLIIGIFTLLGLAALLIVSFYFPSKKWYNTFRASIMSTEYIERDYSHICQAAGESASGSSSSSRNDRVSSTETGNAIIREAATFEPTTAMFHMSSGFVSFDNRFNTTPHLSAGAIDVPEAKVEESSSLSKPKIAKLTRKMDTKE